MHDPNTDYSSPSRSKRVLSVAIWLVVILAVAIGLAWLSTRSGRRAPAEQDDYSKLFHIEAIVEPESFGVSIKHRWPSSDAKRWFHAASYLVSGNDRRSIGEFSGELGSGSTSQTFRDQPRDKPVQVVIEYQVYEIDPNAPRAPGQSPSGPLLYEGRKVSQIIDFPAISREQPSWMKSE